MGPDCIGGERFGTYLGHLYESEVPYGCVALRATKNLGGDEGHDTVDCARSESWSAESAAAFPEASEEAACSAVLCDSGGCEEVELNDFYATISQPCLHAHNKNSFCRILEVSLLF
jgi:hypothetical protein